MVLNVAREGLKHVGTLLPGSGYLEALGGWSTREGFVGRAELGARLRDNLSVFAAGSYSERMGGLASVGARLTW